MPALIIFTIMQVLQATEAAFCIVKRQFESFSRNGPETGWTGMDAAGQAGWSVDTGQLSGGQRTLLCLAFMIAVRLRLFVYGSVPGSIAASALHLMAQQDSGPS